MLPVPSFLTVTKPPPTKALRSAADLFPYQQKAIIHQTSMPNSMMWLDMGLGKTVITLSTISHLRKLGVLRGVIIVAPIRVCKMVWRQEALKWEHTKHLKFSLVTGNKDSRSRAMMQPADVYLVNYENLKWLSSFLHTYYLSAGIPVPANGLVWDECFVKGTLVQTPDSHIAIDKLKIGDVVSTHIGPRRVLNTMQKTTTSLVDVRLSNGSVLRCTPNHPFSVGDDWVAAGNLKKGDVLNEAPQHSEIRGRVLSDLPGGVLEAEGRAVHLFQGVREHLEDATTRSEEGDHFGWDQGATETPRTVRDLEQGDSLARGNAFKNERVTQEARSLTPERRERDGWLVGRELVTYDATAAVPARVHLQGDQEVGGLSDSLQDRLCGPCEQDSYRSSGSVAQYRPWENEGREEATSTGGTWVESVLHHEQGSGVDVWNIHVEEAETYYVGGVLVHNCSKMKNSTTNRVKSFLKIEQCFDWTTGLTGTPASNGYKDLHGQYLVIDKGQRLGRHKTPFKTKFYHKEGPYKEVPMANAETDIKALISDITLEMSAADYNPLPDMIVNDISIEMTGELRDNYEKLEREMFLQLDECTVEVFNKAALMNKCLAEGTEVLTYDGWKRIEIVTSADQVWDGVEWVNVSGIACNGYKNVVECWGVGMTPDHKVLTNQGWREAHEVLNEQSGEGLDRAAVRTPYSDVEGGECSEEEQHFRTRYVASQVRLWERTGTARSKSAVNTQTASSQVLRVCPRQVEEDPRNVAYSSVGELDGDAFSMRQPSRQGLEELRWARDYSVSRVERVRQVLVRYVTRLLGRLDARSHRRERELSQGKLSLGNQTGTGQQHSIQRDRSNMVRSYDGCRGGEGVQPTRYHDTQTDGPGMVGDGPVQTRVYDIINAGPRHRFTVRGRNGEVFIAHNCLQYGAGALYHNTESSDYQVVHDLKLDALEDIIDEAQGNPVLCAYSFKSDADRIMKRFKDLKPVNLTECKSQKSLDEAMRRWKSGDCPLMLAHPASAGHGIDGLQENGNVIVWFGLNWSLDLYSQMNARILRQGQGKPVMCHRIMVTKTVDQIQSIALDSKATTQDGLRRSVKQYRLEKGV